MCFFTQQNAPAKNVKERFNAEIDNEESLLQANEIVGPIHPNIPIILNETPSIITTDYSWGLMPNWADTNQLDYRKGKLNAKIEELDVKPSYKNIMQNRCLILATGFYEWRWLDPKGKVKDKYQIFSSENEIFCFAGLYDTWLNTFSGEIIRSFTMVTTEANELMRFIHNHKMRMPVVLNQKDEKSWLDNTIKISDFAFPYEANIEAKNLTGNEDYQLF